MVEINDEELERRLRAIRLKTSPDLDARVMELGMQPAPRTRRYLVIRVARLAVAAAAVCMVVVLAWWLLSRSEVMPSAYAQLMEAVENSQRTDWVHLHGELEGQEYELWTSSGQPFRLFTRLGGQIFSECGKSQSFYDPTTRTITVRPTQLEREHVGSLFDTVTKTIERAKEEAGVEVTEQEQVLAGEPVKVFTIRYQTSEERYTVDPLAKRMVRVENLKRDGTLFAAYDIDYPDTGPSNIYEFGAPRDARVVDQSPPQPVQDLDEKVLAAREGFGPAYRATVFQTRVHPHEVSVVYKKDGRFRIERYGRTISVEGAAEDERVWQQASEGHQAPLETWLKGSPLSAVEFYDGQWDTFVQSDGKGNLTKQRWKQSKDSVLRVPVEKEVWGEFLPRGKFLLPWARSTTDILPPKESVFGKLTGVKHTWQGCVQLGNAAVIPGRTVQYFNPSRDYVCEESEFEEDTEADWQEDKQWLKDVHATPEARERYVYESRKVLEYAQTADGQWYASKIRNEMCYDRSGAQRLEILTLIYVDTERAIPDELLDPDSVTAEMFQAEEAQQPGSE